jgi:hypothetical protein
MLEVSNGSLCRISKVRIGGEGLLEREMKSLDVHGENDGWMSKDGVDEATAATAQSSREFCTGGYVRRVLSRRV